MERSNPIEFSAVGRTLHWAIGLLAVSELALGQWMDAPESHELRRTLLRLHQSTGLVIAGLVLARLAWRVRAQLPEWPARITTGQRHTLYAVEALLYLGLVSMPLTGVAQAMVGGLPISFFGWLDIPSVLDESDLLSERLELAHRLGARAFLVAILGHFGLVLYLDWKTSPGFLARMLRSSWTTTRSQRTRLQDDE